MRAAPERVQKVIIRRERADARVQQIVALARAQGVPVYRESSRVLDRMAGGARHQGILAETSPVPWLDLEELLEAAPWPAFLLGLDQIEDPRNFGALARAADGAGVHGMICLRRGGAPPSEAALATSSGALLHLRLARVTNLTEALERVKAQGIWVVGLAPSAPLAWFEFDYTVPVLLLVGAEGQGLRRRVAGACDALVHLPQLGRVESLNVSVAAGVVLYEVVRQRLVSRIERE